VKRRLKWAVVGGASCATVALAVSLMTSPSPAPGAPPILVPQATDSELALPKPPTSSVSTLPDSQTPTTTAERVTAAPPPPKTTSKQVGVDFQAENALIRDGAVKSSPAGFTGTGFVDTDNKVGSSVQWTVNASRTGQADVIFRFANGNDGFRPMDVTVNGILVFSLDFPSTGGFDTYRTVTVRVSLIGGANRIKATSSTANGGPNLDKITVA
jgi:hypothetical protein